MREELQSSCDVGSKILESRKMFPEFDFSFLDNISVDPHIWFFFFFINFIKKIGKLKLFRINKNKVKCLKELKKNVKLKKNIKIFHLKL